jgi:hypothetical protein
MAPHRTPHRSVNGLTRREAHRLQVVSKQARKQWTSLDVMSTTEINMRVQPLHCRVDLDDSEFQLVFNLKLCAKSTHSLRSNAARWSLLNRAAVLGLSWPFGLWVSLPPSRCPGPHLLACPLNILQLCVRDLVTVMDELFYY